MKFMTILKKDISHMQFENSKRKKSMGIIEEALTLPSQCYRLEGKHCIDINFW